ncbi:hypothetical protein Ctob_009888 [Chrysochromulina tobinii]|uniref:Uncharacterized protein n=1 Tax=Chrysochromulina tobinii TaxID=1460289 RepID=A0A0M0JHB2_9EUKA|nr:hypothetical protein Ctob_009888 [Chrysochromulina tobinii]|eukprot:KOO25976.1 hypothetical protein Ctob_009888 [Chrysochromulina sp. CCMP291]
MAITQFKSRMHAKLGQQSRVASFHVWRRAGLSRHGWRLWKCARGLAHTFRAERTRQGIKGAVLLWKDHARRVTSHCAKLALREVDELRYDLEDTSGKLALEAALAGKVPALANQRDDLQSRLDEAQSLSIAARREAADLREELGRIRRALEHERARSAGLEAQLQTKTELLDAESQRGSEVQQKLIETIKDP